ncbi:RWD domain-containing protein [Plasmodium brasilianum]|uniref:RWD domain-containing protein n=1 Tax=Plasmodium brasilianum TaxID=5824 RepID=A0ACB9Y8R1_PLABR|nr:RWD domain-containing protein [Plasmodium brasilianum]
MLPGKRDKTHDKLSGVKIHNSNSNSSNVGSTNIRDNNIRSCNIGSSNIGISNIGISNIGISNIGISNIGISNIGISNIRSSNIRSSHIRSSIINRSNIKSAEVHRGKIKGKKENLEKKTKGTSSNEGKKDNETFVECVIKDKKEREKILLQCEELQRKELEALKLIYVRDKELNIKNENNKESDTIIYMQLNDENISDNIINLTFELPKDYPLKSFLIININVKNFTPDMNSYINQEIYKDIQNYLDQESSILNIIYKVNELVENIQNRKEAVVEHISSLSDEQENTSDIKEDEGNENFQNYQNQIIDDKLPFLYYHNMSFSNHKKILARRLCYSHHILNLVKRSCIIKWAKELKIGGYSKIGYPGIIICEGPKDEVDFYINSLNKLRWKHFDCRGMDDIELNEYENIEEARVLPKTMREIDPKGMSTLSDICTQCGLRDLFLTSMKIYNPSRKTATNERNQNVQNNNKERKKKKMK